MENLSFRENRDPGPLHENPVVIPSRERGRFKFRPFLFDYLQPALIGLIVAWVLAIIIPTFVNVYTDGYTGERIMAVASDRLANRFESLYYSADTDVFMIGIGLFGALVGGYVKFIFTKDW